ncbi:hypothetical protein QBC34DRAFT_221076 [Podospora aff. communis PSN243]|uniref:Uncharacterized protein n=1 Tax=Podospora aff. communis PSN243 TaxID=3040156 RepID=A0AAV9GYG5_9PEZI|nr:hypothetical protein QBC34DRAFT_221076 [Podospora aff. communis PSN243]
MAGRRQSARGIGRLSRWARHLPSFFFGAPINEATVSRREQHMLACWSGHIHLSHSILPVRPRREKTSPGPEPPLKLTAAVRWGGGGGKYLLTLCLARVEGTGRNVCYSQPRRPQCPGSEVVSRGTASTALQLRGSIRSQPAGTLVGSSLSCRSKPSPSLPGCALSASGRRWDVSCQVPGSTHSGLANRTPYVPEHRTAAQLCNDESRSRATLPTGRALPSGA